MKRILKIIWIAYNVICVLLTIFLIILMNVKCSPPVDHGKILTGKGSFASEDGLYGGGYLKPIPVGYRTCQPYRIDVSDPCIYIDCPEGNLRIYRDLSDYIESKRSK